MKNLPWFRMYSEAIDDDKLRLLAFEDRWHFVAILCCKGQGILDDADTDFMLRRVSVKLGVQVRELEEIARRLAEVRLIDRHTLQPLAWDARQYQSDSSAERVRAYRERQKKQSGNDMKRYGNVTVTAQDTDTDTDTDTDKVKTLRRSRAFTRPTIDEVAAYCAERGNRIDPQVFVDHYESNGWRVGKTAMKDWQAAVRTWEKRDETNQRTNAANGSGNRTGSTRQYIDKLKQLERDAAHMGDAPFPAPGDDLWPPMDIVPRRP
jgi:hypothetical protein